MPRIIATAAAAALIAAALPAFAADSPAAMTPSSAKVTATQLQPGQLRATDLKGANVYDNQSNKIASVKDMLLDRDGKIGTVVIDVDGKYVGMAMHDLKIALDDSNKPKVIVDMTKDQLKQAQAFDLNTRPATTGSSTPPTTAPIEKR